MAKIPKVVAGYLPARYVPLEGTSCGTCRDFIRLTSECTITDGPQVSGPHGTCILYLKGQPREYGSPLRLIPKSLVGYEEDKKAVPTHCGKCEHYLHPERFRSLCAKVGDSEEDLVEFGGCCNGYEAR